MQPLNTQTLGEFVRNQMDPDGCCHDLLYTRQWLAEQGWDEAEIAAWVAAHEIVCDCETINQFAPRPGEG
jgi:hypothetical protein